MHEQIRKRNMPEMRGRPFEPGNNFGKGRPKGSKNKTRMAMEQLLSQHGEGLVRKCILQAMKGDRNALKLCMDRLVPVRRDGFVWLPTLRTQTSQDLDGASESLVRAVSCGGITPAEAEQVSAILERRRRVIETTEIVGRLEKLETSLAERKN
jgi:hypothetical protein